jgi:hypothetical protein
LELLLLKIDVEKKNGIKREGGRRKEKWRFKSYFLDPLLDKMPTPLFFLVP